MSWPEQTIQDHLCFHFLAVPHTAWRILVPHPGFEPSPSAVEVLSLNHWTTKGSPFSVFFFKCSQGKQLWSIMYTLTWTFLKSPPWFLKQPSVVVISLCLQVLCRSKNRILKECFLVAELENRRRAPTVSVCVWLGGGGGRGGRLCKKEK